MFKLKRVYERPIKSDGQRILVERLWPRGVSKQQAKIDLWVKDLAPSVGLRKWFGHDPLKWSEFQHKYKNELKLKKDLSLKLKKLAQKNTLTFVYAARDKEHNGALVLKEFIENLD
jgi:uncharacterized protein YeaO (DUF488 family)